MTVLPFAREVAAADNFLLVQEEAPPPPRRRPDAGSSADRRPHAAEVSQGEPPDSNRVPEALVRLLVILLLAFGSIADAAVVGSGSSVVIAGGNGVDLLLWRDGSGRIVAMRFGATGAQLDSAPLHLPLPAGAGGPSAAAWDGSGFVVAASGSNSPAMRLPVTGGSGYTVTFAQMANAIWSTVASMGDGSSLFVWRAGVSNYAASLSSTGNILSLHEDLPLAMNYPQAHLVRDGAGYLLASIPSCAFPACEPETVGFVQRLDRLGNLIGPSSTLRFPYAGMTFSSFAEGPRPLLAVSDSSRGTIRTSLLSFDPGSTRAARTTLRFPASLTVQETASGAALIGLGARINLSETGAPLTTNWAPLATGQRLLGVLPSSGMRVIGADSGSISGEAPASDSTEVGLAFVQGYITANTVWLKVDNRGPDAARTIDVWVTAPVRSISSLVSGTITRFGALTRLRFEPNLKQGAGFEIAMYFESPIDPNAFEAWALTLGTDRDATNNYVTTLAAEPEPEPPARRRLVARP